MTNHDPKFDFDNTYARELEGFYVPWQGAKAPAPTIVQFNDELADDLGLDSDALKTADGAAIFAGSVAPDGAAPLAQAYAGHQFGGFSEQLGDGRALLLGELLDKEGARFDLHLKGSGRTPFSRGGDGKAVLGPVLREYLMGEAMHALGVPTTRALAAVTTGEEVVRDGMKPGAVLARIASSHLRVGTFQFFAARKEWDKVRQLADYAIDRHYPELAQTDDKYLGFLSAVLENQAQLVAKWLHLGFVHGVMNTDNMTISGETIDYGPCAFVDEYDPKAVFSSIDRDGRYAFGNQPVIAQWNLTRLAETLLPLIDADDSENAIRLATNVINTFVGRYTEIWTNGMRAKIGLASVEEGDGDLINDMFTAMDGQKVDYTLFFRHLAHAALGKNDEVIALFEDGTKFESWLTLWQDRLLRDPLDPSARAKAMNKVNPIYIPRNHRVEEALVAAEADDLAPFTKLLEVLSDPFTKRAGLDAYEGPAPEGFGPYKTFCGT
ncbi:protein adenylyltransferase SelO [Planktotalea sp.]|uniref:protein adenylyltransferase SelO n=1 Tax=Planktotalea sp. TaxID=2029877 RepID=UPI003D6B9388